MSQRVIAIITAAIVLIGGAASRVPNPLRYTINRPAPRFVITIRAAWFGPVSWRRAAVADVWGWGSIDNAR
jgi:hypothetical protein